MDTYLALSKSDQKLFCEQASTQTGLPSGSIEKDFWVCWTLRQLFSLDKWGAHLAFKGGTSLSKGWKLIERFSEDIDVVIDRRSLGFDGILSSKKIKKLRTECRAKVQLEILPILHKAIEDELGRNGEWQLLLASKLEDPDQQTLLFEYPPVFPGASSYVRNVVKIELGARSDTDPSESPSIRPILHETFPDQLGVWSFSLCTVAPRRTFWEKAMLLHEETFRPKDSHKPRLARHYYDLYCLIKRGEAERALADPELFARVLAHRRVFFNQKLVDYDALKIGTLRLLPAEDLVSEWKKDYEAMRTEMFSAIPPTFEEILEVVAAFEATFNAS
jgi:hypothetical protein